MTSNKKSKICVIVLNWNGEEDTIACIEALKKQTTPHIIVVVDNASKDNFVAICEKKYPDVILLKNSMNKGFAGGVNTGIQYAMDNNFDFVSLINNDAVPEQDWLEKLLQASSLNESYGIATGKLLKTDGKIDSTGDLYTIWGLAYPRGRDTVDKQTYDEIEEVFGATGGASLYRIKMFKQIGLFDEDFFAYYEDVDLSFRAQLSGWKIIYTPQAIAHHKVGASSSKIPGFTTYMTIKNMPWLYWKNMPGYLLYKSLPRFTIAYTSIVLSSIAKGKVVPVIKGVGMTILKLPKKLIERRGIQKNKKVKKDYVSSIITYDLPPNAHKLKRVRSLLRIKN